MMSYKNKHSREFGFTLLELMIVVVVIAILASIGYPSYRDYVIRAKRSAAQSEMLDIANRERQHFINTRTYVDHNTLAYTLPSDVAENYTLTIVPSAGPPPTYTITMTPKLGSSQENDVTLTLNSNGVKTPADKWD